MTINDIHFNVSNPSTIPYIKQDFVNISNNFTIPHSFIIDTVKHSLYLSLRVQGFVLSAEPAGREHVQHLGCYTSQD